MKSRAKVTVTLSPAGLVFASTLVLSALAGLGLLGYRLLAGPTAGSQSPSGSGAAAPTAAGSIVLSEPFDSLARWEFKESSGPSYRFSLKEGALLMEAAGTAVVNYLSGTEFRDGSAEVDARWISGDVDGAARFGMIIRHGTDGSAYYFEYYPYQDGLWVFTLGQGGKFTTLSKGNLSKDRQRSAGTFSRLRVDAAGGRARLYVNDVLLGETDASALQLGRVGLVATAGPGKRATFAFDNFTIRR